MSDKRFKALNDSNYSDFYQNPNPKCPCCGHVVDIGDNELWNLLDENGPHEVECPSCEESFAVSAEATWLFSTHEQDDDEESEQSNER